MGNFFTPFLTLWTRPRQTMRDILSGYTPEWALCLMVVTMMVLSYGVGFIAESIEGSAQMGPEMGLGLAFSIVLVLVFFYLASGLYYLLGRWLCGGGGTYKSCRVAMAWGMIGFVPVMILFTVVVALIPINAVLIAALLVYVILALWYMICVYNMLAEGHGFPSAWQAFGMLLTAYIIFIVIVGIILATLFFVHQDEIENFINNAVMQMMMGGNMMEMEGMNHMGGMEEWENLDFENMDLEGLDPEAMEMYEEMMEDAQ